MNFGKKKPKTVLFNLNKPHYFCFFFCSTWTIYHIEHLNSQFYASTYFNNKSTDCQAFSQNIWRLPTKWFPQPRRPSNFLKRLLPKQSAAYRLLPSWRQVHHSRKPPPVYWLQEYTDIWTISTNSWKQRRFVKTGLEKNSVSNWKTGWFAINRKPDPVFYVYVTSACNDGNDLK